MPKTRSLDPWILHAALEGLEDRAQRLDAYLVVVQRLLSARPGKRVAAGQAGARPKRKVSAASRRRMAAAQKRRWAEYRKKKAGSVKAKGEK